MFHSNQPIIPSQVSVILRGYRTKPSGQAHCSYRTPRTPPVLCCYRTSTTPPGPLGFPIYLCQRPHPFLQPPKFSAPPQVSLDLPTQICYNRVFKRKEPKLRTRKHIDIESDVLPVQPQGTNSTMFTTCCQVAICDSEGRCPKCKKKVYGWDAENAHATGRLRWASATAHWYK